MQAKYLYPWNGQCVCWLMDNESGMLRHAMKLDGTAGVGHVYMPGYDPNSRGPRCPVGDVENKVRNMLTTAYMVGRRMDQEFEGK